MYVSIYRNPGSSCGGLPLQILEELDRLQVTQADGRVICHD